MFFCLCSVGVWQAFSCLGFSRAGAPVAVFVGRFGGGFGGRWRVVIMPVSSPYFTWKASRFLCAVHCSSHGRCPPGIKFVVFLNASYMLVGEQRSVVNE